MSEKPTVRFFEPEDMGPRDWGKEVKVAHVPGKYLGKVLFMRAGSKGGLQYHRLKDETGYVFSGELLVRYDDGNGHLVERIMKPGDCVHIPPGAVHQEEAITDCVIFEVSNPVFDDRVRMEEHYGLSRSGGLPTTDAPRIE